jgi:alanyl-tRNA synthetase
VHHQQRERDSKCPKYIEIACAVFFQREREREREREKVLDGKILMIDREC